MIRQMSVVGSFYPAREIELERYFEHFNNLYDENVKQKDTSSRVVIVPHAGYIYSGYTANIAYKALQKSGVKNIVVIGPSHRVAFEGISICDFEAYQTPFGDIKGSTNLAQELKENFSFKCLENAHREHSTEVQFPFIKFYMPDVNIVEVVYSQAIPKDISTIIEYVLQKDDCGVVISTDLSHFYNLKQANDYDNICLNGIQRVDTDLLDEGCEACGIIGLKAVLDSAKKLNLTSKILDYRTSADASGDEDRVVGYVSACFN